MTEDEQARNKPLDAAAPAGLQPETVARFLVANPGFLAARPALYAALDPPVRVHGEQTADHMAALLAAERATAASVLAQGRNTAAGDRRAQEAVLALLRAADPLDCATQEWPGVLGIDAVTVWAEFPLPGARPLPVGAVAAALGGGTALVRPAAVASGDWHAEATRLAALEALVRVPLPRPALLALGCRDPGGVLPAAATLTFLGRALAAALSR